MPVPAQNVGAVVRRRNADKSWEYKGRQYEESEHRVYNMLHFEALTLSVRAHTPLPSA